MSITCSNIDERKSSASPLEASPPKPFFSQIKMQRVHINKRKCFGIGALTFLIVATLLAWRAYAETSALASDVLPIPHDLLPSPVLTKNQENNNDK